MVFGIVGLLLGGAAQAQDLRYSFEWVGGGRNPPAFSNTADVRPNKKPVKAMPNRPQMMVICTQR